MGADDDGFSSCAFFVWSSGDDSTFSSSFAPALPCDTLPGNPSKSTPRHTMVRCNRMGKYRPLSHSRNKPSYLLRQASAAILARVSLHALYGSEGKEGFDRLARTHR